MGRPLKKKEGEYKYGDYLRWPDEVKCELIDGTAYDMTPAPSAKHQRIVGELFRQIANYLLDRPCEVFIAPFDVRLPKGSEKDEDIKTVVQPDITIVCDQSKLDDSGCKGSPDMIIEVISPHTLKKDLKEKLHLYESAGVREYWIVHPADKTVMVFKSESPPAQIVVSAGEKGLHASVGYGYSYGKPDIFTEEDSVKTGIFEDLFIELKTVFK